MKMIKCSICNRRWFFSSKVKCNCKAEQLKVQAAALPVRRSIQNNNDNDIALFAMHQQETLKQQYSDFSESCRTELPSSGFRSFDLSPSHCNSLHDSSSSSSYETSSSYDSGSTSSSSWD
ncbi:hypothetical protein [Acinetobacter sp. ANC 4973]|uniref:hypothetical protein n=1 Tax=Acinetobacter sp. ANC 4973 TaxID=1977871 RepID=UPI001177C2AC|nr:hypothetical protein [Acinetobacter sp. ANC 4973]